MRKLTILQRINVQTRSYIECQIGYKDFIYHCGMHSHSSYIYEDSFEIPYLIRGKSCRYALSMQRLKLDENLGIDVKINKTVTEQVVIDGLINKDGSCQNAAFTSNSVQYNAVRVRRFRVTIRRINLDFDTNTASCITSPYTDCRLYEQHCSTTRSTLHQIDIHMNKHCPFRKTRIVTFSIFKLDSKGHTQYTENDVMDLRNRLIVSSNDNDMVRMITENVEEQCATKLYTTTFEDIYVTFSEMTLDFAPIVPNTISPVLATNVKLNFLLGRTQEVIRDIYYAHARTICENRRSILQNKLMIFAELQDQTLGIMSMNPMVFAKVSGSVLNLIKCKQVEVKLRQANNVCYKHVPIVFNNRSLCIHPVTRIIQEECITENCSRVLEPGFEYQPGKWIKYHHRLESIQPPKPLPLNISKHRINWINITSFKDAGIYTSSDVKTFYRNIMYPSRLQSLQADVVNHVKYAEGRFYMDNSITFSVKEKLETVFREMFGFFSTFGTYTSAALGVYYLFVIIKLVVSRLIDALSLHHVYGVNWKILFACVPFLTKILVTRKTTRNIDKLRKHYVSTEAEDAHSNNMELMERNIRSPYKQERVELRRTQTTKQRRIRKEYDFRKICTPPAISAPPIKYCGISTYYDSP